MRKQKKVIRGIERQENKENVRSIKQTEFSKYTDKHIKKDTLKAAQKKKASFW